MGKKTKEGSNHGPTGQTELRQTLEQGSRIESEQNDNQSCAQLNRPVKRIPAKENEDLCDHKRIKPRLDPIIKNGKQIQSNPIGLDRGLEHQKGVELRNEKNHQSHSYHQASVEGQSPVHPLLCSSSKNKLTQLETPELQPFKVDSAGKIYFDTSALLLPKVKEISKNHQDCIPCHPRTEQESPAHPLLGSLPNNKPTQLEIPKLDPFKIDSAGDIYFDTSALLISRHKKTPKNGQGSILRHSRAEEQSSIHPLLCSSSSNKSTEFETPKLEPFKVNSTGNIYFDTSALLLPRDKGTLNNDQDCIPYYSKTEDKSSVHPLLCSRSNNKPTQLETPELQPFKIDLTGKIYFDASALLLPRDTRAPTKSKERIPCHSITEDKSSSHPLLLSLPSSKPTQLDTPKLQSFKVDSTGKMYFDISALVLPRPQKDENTPQGYITPQPKTIQQYAHQRLKIPAIKPNLIHQCLSNTICDHSTLIPSYSPTSFNLIKQTWLPPKHISVISVIGNDFSMLTNVENSINVRIWPQDHFNKLIIMGTERKVSAAVTSLNRQVRFLESSMIASTPLIESQSLDDKKRNTLLTERSKMIAELKSEPIKPKPINSSLKLPNNIESCAIFGNNLEFLDQIIYKYKVNLWINRQTSELMISASDQIQHDQAFEQIKSIYNLFLNHFPSLKRLYLLYITAGDKVVLRKPNDEWLLNNSSNQVTTAYSTQQTSTDTLDYHNYNKRNHYYTTNDIKAILSSLGDTSAKVELRVHIGKVMYNMKEPKSLPPSLAHQVLENLQADSEFGYFNDNISPIMNNIENLRQKCNENLVQESSCDARIYIFKVVDISQSVYKFTITFNELGEATISPYYKDDIYPVRVYHSVPKEPLDYSTEVKVNEYITEPNRFLKTFSESIKFDPKTQWIKYMNNMAISLKHLIKKEKHQYNYKDYKVILTQYFKYNMEIPKLVIGQPYESVEIELNYTCDENGFSIKILKECWNDLAANNLETGDVSKLQIEELFNENIAIENHEAYEEIIKILF